MHRLQVTLAIMKPDLVGMPFHLELVRSLILQRQFYVVGSRCLRLSRGRAEQFYHEHQHKFFFNRLVTFMSSGLSHVHILARINAIQEWRDLMGPTKVFHTRHTQPNSIRGSIGLTDTRNATHGSDSSATARREIAFFFPEFDANDFMENQSKQLKQSVFDRAAFLHRLPTGSSCASGNLSPCLTQ